MKRFLCGVVFILTFPLLLVLAGLVSVLRGLQAVIAWVADLATPPGVQDGGDCRWEAP